MTVSISIYHDTRRAKQNNKYPLKLRVSNQISPTELYPTIFDLTESEFKKLSAPRISDELDTIRKKLKELLSSAQRLAEELDPFSLYEFERDFIIDNPLIKVTKIKAQPPTTAKDNSDFTPYLKKFPILNGDISNPETLMTLYVAYVKKLLLTNRIGSAENYQDSCKSLIACWGNITLKEVNADKLIAYEQYMIRKGRSLTTVGIKLRHLRTIFNKAIKTGIISRKKYPFDKDEYVIPNGNNIKKALTTNDVSKIYFYNPNSSVESYGRDMWLFLYLANGMNPKDMAALKYKDIDEDFFCFQRLKTINTTRHKPKIISVYITDDMKTIMNRWGNKNTNPDSYIFPILTPGLSAFEQHYTVKKFITQITSILKPIASSLNISRKVNPSAARHSHATHLKRAGASTSYIQEILGHSVITTTENYLDSFERDVKKDFTEKVFSFKKS